MYFTGKCERTTYTSTTWLAIQPSLLKKTVDCKNKKPRVKLFFPKTLPFNFSYKHKPINWPPVKGQSSTRGKAPFASFLPFSKSRGRKQCQGIRSHVIFHRVAVFLAPYVHRFLFMVSFTGI